MYRKYIKRILDIIISFILLILFSPIILSTAFITYMELGLPLFNHRKQKEGKNHKVFTMYKFRTSLPKKPGSNEKVFTNITRIIDYSRLNELPQLFNVLKGDMSIVGPRPFIPGDKLPKDKISEKRYLVKPGITGLFQIKTGGTHKEKLKCDIEYYDNLSFLLDLKIVLYTPIALIKKLAKLKNKKTG